MTTTIQQFPLTLEDRLAELEAARAHLMAELESVADAAPTEPGSERWSIAEVAHHLHLSERGILRLIQRALESGERHERKSNDHLQAEWERVCALVGSRQHPASAPSPVVPTNAPSLAETVEHLKHSRQALFEMLGRVTLDELASISIPHPLQAIGVLTGAGWLSVIANHERRHTEQIREITSSVNR
jgi:uncharacterized damage-inducible protein DinB